MYSSIKNLHHFLLKCETEIIIKSKYDFWKFEACLASAEYYISEIECFSKNTQSFSDLSNYRDRFKKCEETLQQYIEKSGSRLHDDDDALNPSNEEDPKRLLDKVASSSHVETLLPANQQNHIKKRINTVTPECELTNVDKKLGLKETHQSQISHDMIGMIKDLKENILSTSRVIKRDNMTLDEANEQESKNVLNMKLQNKRVHELRKKASTFGTLVFIFFIFLIFFVTLIFMRLFHKKY